MPKQNVKLSEIRYESENRIANLLATKKYLNIPIVEGRELVRCSPCVITFDNPRELLTSLAIDDLKDHLDNFEIKIKVTIN